MASAEESYLKFIGGDSTAFSAVIDEYRDKLIFFINGFVKNEDTAEEIAADCFAELIARPKSFAFKSSLKTYIFSVAHHKAVNFIKKNARLTLFGDDTPIEKSVNYIEFETDFFKNERFSMLHKALGKIKENYATAIHLVFFEEMSYKETAVVMNKTVKQIDNYVSRGKASLRKILEEEGFEYEE